VSRSRSWRRSNVRYGLSIFGGLFSTAPALINSLRGCLGWPFGSWMEVSPRKDDGHHNWPCGADDSVALPVSQTGFAPLRGEVWGKLSPPEGKEMIVCRRWLPIWSATASPLSQRRFRPRRRLRCRRKQGPIQFLENNRLWVRFMCPKTRRNWPPSNCKIPSGVQLPPATALRRSHTRAEGHRHFRDSCVCLAYGRL
jgi:hypothetical protein